MRTLLTFIALCAVTARADAPPADAPPKPEVVRGLVRETCRCAFVEAEDPWLLRAPWAVHRAFLRGSAAPQGWTAVAEPVAPDPEDPAWTLVVRPGMPICASAQLYDTPLGRVRVVAVTLRDVNRVPLFGVKLDKARGKEFAPVGTGREHVVMITPPVASLSTAWSAAAAATQPTEAFGAMTAAAAKDDLAAFDAASREFAKERPTSAVPHALRAGILVRKGATTAARAAALEAASRAEGDPSARAEALHWAFIAEYQLGRPPDVTLPLTEQQVRAAKLGGGEPMIVRAVYDRACARALSGDAEGAVSDLREALTLETLLGRREYHAIAVKEPDFASLRGRPDFEDALKTP